MAWAFSPGLPAAAQLLSLAAYTLIAEPAATEVAGFDISINQTGYAIAADTAAFSVDGQDVYFGYFTEPPLVKYPYVTNAGYASSISSGGVTVRRGVTVLGAAGSICVVSMATDGISLDAPTSWTKVLDTDLVTSDGFRANVWYCEITASILNTVQWFTFTGASAIPSFTDLYYITIANLDRNSTFELTASTIQDTASTTVEFPGFESPRDNTCFLILATSNNTQTTKAAITAASFNLSSTKEYRDIAGHYLGFGVANQGTVPTISTTASGVAAPVASATLVLRPTMYTGEVLTDTTKSLTNRQVSSGATFKNVRHLNGAYFATGDAGANYRSDDGLSWTPISYSYTISDIAYGNSVYVGAVSSVSTQVAYSTDGLSFSSKPHGLGTVMTSCCFGGGKFVIVGSLGKIGTSEDGITWTAQNSGNSSTLNSVIWDGNQFVAVGSSSTVLTSPDGITWTKRNNVPSYSYSLNSIAYNGSRYIATYNNSGSVLYSFNGLDWETRSLSFTLTSAVNQRINLIDGVFVLTSTAFMAVSADGTKWTLIDTGIAGNLMGSAATPDLMVLADDLGNLWSCDLPTKSSVSVKSYESEHAGFKYNKLKAGVGLSDLIRGYTPSSLSLGKGVSDGNGNWVVLVSSSSTNYFGSTDGGLTFSTRTSVLAARTAAAYGAGMFVFVGTSGFIESSPSGLTGTWTTRTSGTSNTINDITYANGKFVAVGNSGDVCVSTDGVDWTLYTTPFGVSLRSIIWDGTQYMASSLLTYNTYVSEDGITWTAGPNIDTTSSVYFNLSYGNGVYIAGPINSNGIRVSFDGLNWQFYSLPDAITSVGRMAFTGKKHIIPRGGSGGIFYTTEDGIKFTQYVQKNASTFAAAASDGFGNILVTGASGYAVSAKDEAFESEFKSVGYDISFSNLVSYQFNADQAAYLLAPSATGLAYGRILGMDTVAYSQTVQPANLMYGRYLAGAQSTYSLTANAAGTYYNRRVTADSLGYSVDVLSAGLNTGFGLVAATGAIALNGITAQMYYGKSLPVNAAAYSLLGQDTLFNRGYSVPGQQASYTHAGNAVNLLSARYVAANLGTYSHSGQANNMVYGRWMTSTVGELTAAGQSANVLRTAYMAGNQGSYIHVGNAAGTCAGRQTTADAQSYVAAGQTGNVLANRKMLGTPSTYAYTGFGATVEADRHIVADQRLVDVNGIATPLSATRWLGTSGASYASAWYDVGFTTGFGLVANLGAFALSGSDVSWAWQRFLNGEVGSYNEAVFDALVLAHRKQVAQTTSYSAEFQTSTLAYGRTVVASMHDYSTQTYNVLVRRRYVQEATSAQVMVDWKAGWISKGRIFGVQSGLYQILGYSSAPFFSELKFGKDVLMKSQELTSLMRQPESTLTVRRADGQLLKLAAQSNTVIHPEADTVVLSPKAPAPIIYH